MSQPRCHKLLLSAAAATRRPSSTAVAAAASSPPRLVSTVTSPTATTALRAHFFLLTRQQYQSHPPSHPHHHHHHYRNLLTTLPRRRPATARTMSTTTPSKLPSTLTGPPVAAYVAPGACQLTSDPTPCRLVSRTAVSETSSVLRFALPQAGLPLNLATCACLLAQSSSIVPGDTTTRPYTPISTNANVGYFDLLVKNYGEQGLMSRHLHEIEIGSTDISFFHIPFNVKLQAPEFKRYKQVL
mmetsp:Transcript_13894/g.31549  ORF Transcript_13894/g.31549 Transcript_13894/m.31549 type:complete len:242 (+) Transcript_13894:93-818(+)